jgi:NADPH-dependent 2,4-dienoyl-CoA reductase/sulfur reductase-like enzyme/ferredoxin
MEYGYVFGFIAFFIAVSSRKWLFNASGPATGLLVLTALVAAFIGGLFFKGKSGWCSSICPLYPMQRLYNQTPFVIIPNSHCSNCVGCTKNCYDFNPSIAYLADLYDDDRYYTNYRKFFAAAMPGFLLAYFVVPNTPEISIANMYAQFALHISASLGVFYLGDSLVKVSTNKLTGLFAAVTFNIFYAFTLPLWLDTVYGLFGLAAPAWLKWAGQAVILVGTLLWIMRTYRKEPLFLQQVRESQMEETRIGPATARVLKQAVARAQAEITFLPTQTRVLADPGRTILEIAEANNQPIEAGCRMGMCGADPIQILSGMENLTPVGNDEQGTLDRLGLAGGPTRLACMCRVKGSVSLSLGANKSQVAGVVPASTTMEADPSIRSVVIIGNGIAGVTAADYVRRHHPTCEIHLVARERHNLYNRMAISRLVYGRSAMSGLYLQPDSWYEERNITCWLNTHAIRIDPDSCSVMLATGETLPYDRLILAMGSASFVPRIEGYGVPGSFVLREAEDAMMIRSYAQTQQCRRAVIAGGGLLGLEAAYALKKLGLEVTILERGDRLLRRQLDERGSHFLFQHLSRLGLEFAFNVEIKAVRGNGHVREVRLSNEEVLPCDMVLIAAGNSPNVELARSIGVTVAKGVVVNDRMGTSVPNIFAAGDVSEYNSQLSGLWPIAVEQAKVAAINAVGGQQHYRAPVTPTSLKVVGVELTSIGDFEASGVTDTVIALENLNENRYRKLVIRDNKIVGAICLGYPQEATHVVTCLKNKMDVSSCLESLHSGNWDILETIVPQA